MKVMVHGFYGAGNAGDDAILEAIISGLCERLPEPSFVVSRFGGHNVEMDDYGQIKCIRGRDPTALLEELRDCDLIVVGGGGILQDYHGFDLKAVVSQKPSEGLCVTAMGYYGLPVMLGRVLGKPAILCAIGAGPFHSAEAGNAAAWLVETAHATTVRDAGSAEELRAYGSNKAQVTADVAFCLVPPGGTAADIAASGHRQGGSTKGEGLQIGANLRHWAFGISADRVLDEMAKALDEPLRRENAQVLVLPFNLSRGELKLARRAASAIGHGARVVPYEGRPRELQSFLGGLDLVVGMRLHAAVLAMAAGTPAIGIAYDPKVTRLYEEMALQELCLGPDGLSDRALRERIDLVLTDLAGWRKRVTAAAELMRLRAQINLDKAAALAGGISA